MARSSIRGPADVDKRRPPSPKRPGRAPSPPPPGGIPFWLVRTFLGSVLIAAGAIKFYELNFESYDESTSTLLLLVFAEVELLGGLGMVIGFDPELTRRWSAAAFAGLAISSLFQALAGKCSCACFGSLSINPWLTLVLDLLAVAAILGSRRPAGSEATPLAWAPRLLGPGILALAIGIGGWGQADLVTVAGTATADGHPLEEAALTFTGVSGQIALRTDHDGHFRLPLVRPGQYAVSAPGRVVTRTIEKPEPADKGRGKKEARRSDQRSGPPPSPGAGEPLLLWIEVPTCSQSDLLIKL
jgi:hypothetical protein